MLGDPISDGDRCLVTCPGYYLSEMNKMQGTPERPLSDLGLKGYLSYWASVILRTLALALNTKEAPIRLIADESSEALRQLFQDQEVMRIRRILAGLPAPPNRRMDDINTEGLTEEQLMELKRRRRLRLGTDTRQSRRSSSKRLSSPATDRGSPALLTPPKTSSSSRSKIADVAPIEQQLLTIDTTLERLALACNLRCDDVAFALAECGMLTSKLPGAGQSDGSILLTLEIVLQNLKQRLVKRPLLDLNYVLI